MAYRGIANRLAAAKRFHHDAGVLVDEGMALIGATPGAPARRGTILGFIALLASGCAALASGTERWPVKVGTDRDATKVANLPQATTITQLISIAPPAHPESRRNARFAPTELTTFQIGGILTVIKKEADQDYHLVIADPSNPRVTMIVESPDPTCASGSRFLDNITFVRTTLDRTLALEPTVEGTLRSQPNVQVAVTGVAFFDSLHGQEGVAPNGIELHPILMIDFQR
jgi:hypothetical protein